MTFGETSLMPTLKLTVYSCTHALLTLKKFLVLSLSSETLLCSSEMFFVVEKIFIFELGEFPLPKIDDLVQDFWQSLGGPRGASMRRSGPKNDFSKFSESVEYFTYLHHGQTPRRKK